MTRFQIVSDLHIEHNILNPLELITPVSDILILAGDIGSLYKMDQLTLFITGVCKMFKLIIYIPGNYEYYTIEGYKPLSQEVLTDRLYGLTVLNSNLHILNRESIIIGDVCIIGATLWSEPKVKLPKFIVRIHNISTYSYKNMHTTDLEYINHMIEYANNKELKVLVVTHYCPSYSVVPELKLRNRFISFYASSLDHLLDKKKVHTWVCGHIHHNFDIITPLGCRLVGNQKGKPKDRIIDFSSNFTIDV